MAPAVVFDLFHTLVNPEDFTPEGYSYRRNLVELLGVDRQDFHRFWDATYVERETKPIDLVELVDRHLADCGRPAMTPQQRRSADHWFGVGKDESLRRPPSEVVELVRRAGERGPVGVLSNCHERETRCWSDSPLAPLITAIVRSCDIGAMKPQPEPYRQILQRLGVAAGDCVYVGNGGGDELAGARRAGFGRLIHMNGFDRSNGLVEPAEQARRTAQADAAVESVGGLIDAVLGSG